MPVVWRARTLNLKPQCLFHGQSSRCPFRLQGWARGMAWVKQQHLSVVQDVCGEGCFPRDGYYHYWKDDKHKACTSISRIVRNLVTIKSFMVGSNKDFRHSLVLHHPLSTCGGTSYGSVSEFWRQMLSAALFEGGMSVAPLLLGPL